MYETAEEVIAVRNRARADQATFRSLWQETADLVFPRENQITTTQTPGASRMTQVWDTTAMFDSQDMASDMSAALIPDGERFFSLKTADENLMNNERVARYCSSATDIQHQQMFASNFMLQFNESLRSLGVFGTCNLFSEWGRQTNGLNYKDWDIAMYQIMEDSEGRVDSMFLTFFLTARQAVQEFGEANVGEAIQTALERAETSNNLFEFIHFVGPREEWNPRYEGSESQRFKSMFVACKDKTIVDEGGFREFPFAVARWLKSSTEVYGRGQGTEILPEVKVLQQIKKAYVDCANRFNTPPMEVLDTFEGDVNLTPLAVNIVQEMNSIKAIQQQALGSPPVTKEILEHQQAIIHTAFFRDIFAQIMNLPGTHRTAVEIRERVKEAMRRLASPVARLQSELLDPLITRSYMLLVRHKRIPKPPEDLEGQPLTIEYMGELALVLRDQQARGFVQFTEVVGAVSEIYPEAVDLLDFDKGLRSVARSHGVKTEHIATEEDVEEKRRQRQEAQQAQQELEAAQVATQGYQHTRQAPESGSPADELLAALKE